jgi:SAM-dependent methyltransferase
MAGPGSASLLPDYSRQAETYDATRAASPSVLGPLREALAGAPGRRLADVGGGTGNYARALAAEGWDCLVVDRSPGMLARAAAKGLRTLEADAQDLPFPDGTFDAVMLVSMLHHVEQPRRAIAEACRVVVGSGRVALMAFTREDVEASWFGDYFPSTRAWTRASHPTLAQLCDAFPPPAPRRLPVVFADLQDGSLAALGAHPERVLDAGFRRQTSYFERLERDHPDELARGLARLERELAEGRAPREAGPATVLAWTRPA